MPPAPAGADDDWPGVDRLADVIDVLASTLTGHLAHEERDGLPLIGVALTAGEWRKVGFRIARQNGMSASAEMFAWMLDGADRPRAAATLGQLPPPLARALPRRLEAPLRQDPPLVTRASPPGPATTMDHRCCYSDHDGPSLLLGGARRRYECGFWDSV